MLLKRFSVTVGASEGDDWDDPCNVPPVFCCPITCDVMADPVVAPDGHSYERTAIGTWLKRSTKSPVSGVSMSSKKTYPNIALRSMIGVWAEKTGLVLVDATQPAAPAGSGGGARPPTPSALPRPQAPWPGAVSDAPIPPAVAVTSFSEWRPRPNPGPAPLRRGMSGNNTATTRLPRTFAGSWWPTGRRWGGYGGGGPAASSENEAAGPPAPVAAAAGERFDDSRALGTIPGST